MFEEVSLRVVAIYPIMALICLVILWSAPEVYAATVHEGEGAAVREEKSRKSDINKIRATLEDKISNRQVLHKAEDKLCVMTRPNLRLLSSLCDRISEDESTAGADIAYSMVAALIVFS